MFFLKSLDRFWGKNPAFFLGITLLHAVYLALIFNIWVLFSFLVFAFSVYKRMLQIVVLGVCTYFYTLILYPGQTIEKEDGMASLTIHEVQKIAPVITASHKRALCQRINWAVKSEDHSIQKVPAYFYFKGLLSNYLNISVVSTCVRTIDEEKESELEYDTFLERKCTGL